MTRPRITLLSLFLAAFLAPAPGSRATAAPLLAERGPYRLEVLVDGVPAPSYRHDGDTWVLGRRGARYELKVSNHSDRRVEVVVSVDGRDVIDGTPADYRHKRGYLVPPHDALTIDGWRVSQREAAAFRFSSVADSYAARTGSAREVGVIGVAIFPERPRPVQRPAIASEAKAEPSASDAGSRSRREDSAGEAESAGAASAGAMSAPAPERRPGLGTGFGEAVSSPVEEVEFHRASPHRPAALLALRYDDAQGLRAAGIVLHETDQDEVERRRGAEPFPGERVYAAPPAGWTGNRDLR